MTTQPSAARARQSALAAACLTAGLVTAFADAPAHAVVAVTTPTTSAGFQLYDGSFLTPGSTSPDETTTNQYSPQAPPPGTGPVGVLLVHPVSQRHHAHRPGL